MDGIDPRACEYAIGSIADGNLFEQFGLALLSRLRGYEFTPVGGHHDRGIDGLEHTFTTSSVQRTVYQLSIEKDSRAKIRSTIQALKKNKVEFNRLFYVTNQKVPEQDLLIDQLFNDHNVAVVIWDIEWFVHHINDSPGTVQAYLTFVESYFHEFNQPGKSFTVADLDGDPRLFVFLRQLFEEYGNSVPLSSVLADALILFSLEGTDPDKGILRTRDEIIERIRSYVRFEPNHIVPLINERLVALSTKPRRINHHRKEDAFVLRYEARLEIQNRNLNDLALSEDFKSQTIESIQNYIPPPWTSAEAFSLVEEVLHQVYRQQGLEFANFILNGEAGGAIEKSAPDIIGSVVDQHARGKGSRNSLKTGLLMTFRDLVYNASREQKEYLTRLSRTYMMLFMLQCDPQIGTFFATLMSKMRIYVDTSILLPAMSEYYLDTQNRRYTNLLLGARNAGAKLRINRTIVNELASHLRIVQRMYEEEYKGLEEIYSEEIQILYIPEILLRSYHYARMRGQVGTFNQFFEAFVTPSVGDYETQMISWLRDEYGIDFVSDDSLEVQLRQEDLSALTRELESMKSDKVKAENDAKLVLTIYALREKDNEAGTGGITGYRTWWLSTDTMTERAVRKVFEGRFPQSCYIRTDFLHHFVALAPARDVIDNTFKEMFPSLAGVSVSYHLPDAVSHEANQFVREHASLTVPQRKRILASLVERLKSDPAMARGPAVRHYLDEQLAAVTEGHLGN